MGAGGAWLATLGFVISGAHAMREGGALVFAESLERIVQVVAHALKKSASNGKVLIAFELTNFICYLNKL